MERLLVRLQTHSPESWVLKGGVALELRLRERARTTIDMDLGLELEVATPASAIGEEILDRLYDAWEREMDDYFEFRIPRTTDSDLRIEGVNAHRFAIVVSLAGRIFDRFQLDVAPEEPGSLPTEEIEGSGLLRFAEIPIERFRSVALARHLAEKIHAYAHPRERRTRVKDLLDILLIRELGLPATSAIRQEIAAVFGKRGAHPIPDTLPAPPPEWRVPFKAEAPRTGLGPMTLDQAEHQLDQLWKNLGY
jgi:predicted nucleotidyltransferase component of viral defense system